MPAPPHSRYFTLNQAKEQLFKARKFNSLDYLILIVIIIKFLIAGCTPAPKVLK
jgi:hypothetical protein